MTSMPDSLAGRPVIVLDPMLATCCSFFFFQAEDGIRGGRVTGVQTCALPIWWLNPVANGLKSAISADRSDSRIREHPPDRKSGGQGQAGDLGGGRSLQKH